MKRCLLVAAMLAFSTATAFADDGRPTSSKLAQLGLSSMEMVSDDAGTQVRGEGLGIVSGRFLSIAGTSFFDLAGGFISGPQDDASANFGTVDPISGINTPIAVNFSQSQPGANLFISSVSQGSVFGFAR